MAPGRRYVQDVVALKLVVLSHRIFSLGFLPASWMKT